MEVSLLIKFVWILEMQCDLRRALKQYTVPVITYENMADLFHFLTYMVSRIFIRKVEFRISARHSLRSS
jgi:hypothetical protein